MRHRIGFRTAGFARVSLDECLQTLAAIGYDGVEICLEHPDTRPENLTPAACADIRSRAADLGLEIASVSYHADFEDEAQRAENQLRAIDLTPHFGTETLIINARKTVAGQAEAQLEQFADLLRETLVPRAEAAGVYLACEPEPGMFVNGTPEMVELMRLVGSPRLGVNLDIGHAFLTDVDLPASITELGDRILHVHFEDMPAGVHQHLVPGDGDMNLVEIVAALDAVGFGGYYAVDLFNIADAPEDWARRAYATMREMV